MQKNTVKVAMGQMLVEGGEIRKNLGRAEAMIEAASAESCGIIVLPECIDIGWTYPEAPALAQSIPGPNTEFLCECARRQNIHVLAGLTERGGDRIYNAAVLISPQGEILAKHRKINILDIAMDIYTPGSWLAVTETPLGRIGIDICADNFSDTYVIGHTLARMGADMILSPASWAIPPDYQGDPNPCRMWEVSYTRLAKLFDIPVVGVSNTGIVKAGVWKDYHCIGNSLAVSASGEIVKTGPFTYTEQTLMTVELEITENKKTGTDISSMLLKKGFEFPQPYSL